MRARAWNRGRVMRRTILMRGTVRRVGWLLSIALAGCTLPDAPASRRQHDAALDVVDVLDVTSDDVAIDTPDAGDVRGDIGPALDVDVYDAEFPDARDVLDVTDVVDAPDAPDVTDVPDVPDSVDVADGELIDSDIPCPTGMTRCGGVCVDSTSDNANCGACGRACGPNQSCQSGACACVAGTADCDGNPANGCETDLSSSVTNCGHCGTVCPARANSTATCVGGTCVPHCAAGFGDCDGMESNGCEIDLSTSLTHCGACGNVCSLRPNALTMTCTAGRCAVGSCVNGYGDCNMSEPDGCEVAGYANPFNCGGCNRACAAGQACVNAMCTSCTSPRVMCGTACVDTLSDRQNCGACGTVCPTGAACASGRCVCPTGQTLCGTACANTASDTRNCGRCGGICPTGATCSGGTCNCPSGQVNCGAACVRLSADNANCGACGVSCSGCILGGCVCGNLGGRCCLIGSACGFGLMCSSGRCS